MEKEKILAKSHPEETLLEHSVKTLNIAEELLNRTGVVDECLHDITLIAAAFHDIGKCTEDFQNHILNDDKANLSHNVISFKIVDELVNINKKLTTCPFDESYAKEIVMKSILHHHPIPEDMVKYKDKLKDIESVSEEDTELAVEIIDQIIEVLNPRLKQYEIFSKRTKSFFIPTNDYSYFRDTTDPVFNSYVNVSNGVVRFADILASNNEEIESYTDFTFDSSKIEFKKPEGYDDRFFKHLEYAGEMIDKQIVDLFAPTGFGKTMIYVLWFLKSNKKVCCVSPTNEIAISNYKSVMKELKALGLDGKVKVGLLLTNEWKEGSELKDKNDVIVTNIDNFTRPLFKCDERKPMCFNFNNCHSVFDEFQQYTSDSAIMSMFEIALYGRSLCTNSKTILTSATRNEHLYKTLRKSVKQIDVDYSKYGERKYRCEFRQFDPKKDTENFLMVVNSVKMSQTKCMPGWINYHAKFFPDDKEYNRQRIIKTHGKDASLEERKTPVVSTNIISTGIDISFRKVIFGGIPMEEMIQIAGRCNRWDEYTEGTLVFSEQFKDGSEEKAIELKYDKRLRNLEYKMLKERIGDRTITMSELYTIVESIKNDDEYKKLYKTYMDKCKKESCKNLSKMTYTYSGEKIDTDEIVITDNHNIRKIESNVDWVSIFVTLPGYDGYIQENYMNEDELHRHHLDYMYEYVKKRKLYKKYGNHEKLYKDKGTSEINKKYIKLAKHSSTPYILNPKFYIYTKDKGLQEV